MVAKFHVSETQYLTTEVNQMIADISYQMLAENDPQTPPESRFVSAECTDIAMLDDQVRIRVSIRTAANTEIQFQVPLSAN
jgi:hypothetical protein